jgi:hypothetical protein
MKFAGVYGILVGVGMIAQWTFLVAAGQVPELQTEPFRIAAHLAAEFLTAAGLVASGIGLLRRAAWSASTYLFFAGMLTYSVIASPGYFAQQGQWIFVGMFAVLLALALASVYALSRPAKKRGRYAEP